MGINFLHFWERINWFSSSVGKINLWALRNWATMINSQNEYHKTRKSEQEINLTVWPTSLTHFSDLFPIFEYPWTWGSGGLSGVPLAVCVLWVRFCDPRWLCGGEGWVLIWQLGDFGFAVALWVLYTKISQES